MTHIDSYRIIGSVEPPGKNKYRSFKTKRNGNPPDSGGFTLFPLGKKVKVKASFPMDDSPDSWVIEVKGAAASDFFSGSILIPVSYGAVQGKKALVIWKGTPPKEGTLDLKMRDLPDYAGCRVSFNGSARVSRMTGQKPFLQIPGQIYQLTGRDTLVECVLLMAEPFTPEQSKLMTKRVAKFGNFPGPDSIYSMNLRVRGFICLPEHLSGKDYEGAVRKGDWLIMDRLCEKWLKTIEKRAGSESGVNEAGLSTLLDCPEGLVYELVSEQIALRKITRSQGYLINVTEFPEQQLSPMTRSFYEELKQAAQDGLNVKEAASWGRPDMPHILHRRGLARKLDHFLIEEGAYSLLVSQILTIVPKDKSFDLSDLTGTGLLSRSRLLLLLDEMEKDGLIKSCGDNRRTLV